MVGYRLARAAEVAEQSHGEWGSHGHQEDHHSDDERSFDERSIAADSWSVKSEYGSTLDGDDTRHAEVMEVMATVADRATHGGCSEDEEEEEEGSVLGLRSHWDSTYAEELTNFHEHGNPGEIWFGETVLETSAEWTARIAAAVSAGVPLQGADRTPASGSEEVAGTSAACLAGDAASWRVLDLGTGNGLLLHALAKHGFSDLTGTDYCEAAVELARAVAHRADRTNINFLVDDVLETKLEGQFDLVTDKGTLDAVKLHPDGKNRRKLYRRTVEKLTAPGGLLVITSCNSTKDELVADITGPSERAEANGKGTSSSNQPHLSAPDAMFEYVDHVRTYPTFRFGGAEGTRVCTVAFRSKARPS